MPQGAKQGNQNAAGHHLGIGRRDIAKGFSFGFNGATGRTHEYPGKVPGMFYVSPQGDVSRLPGKFKGYK
jgi:hypothetical protein